MHTLEARIRKANAEGRPALIPFLTAHFPDRERFWSAFDDLDAGGADIIELGVPFSDPVADGPVVEEASRRVLEAGFRLNHLLEELADRREGRARPRKGDAGLVLMGYLNPFLSYGLERLARDAARAGVSGCIIPDVPHEEAAPVREALAREGIALIPLVGPNTGEERMAECAAAGEGYMYVVSVMGVTGERAALAPQVAATMGRARRASALPLALGFGLSRPEQLADLPPEARPDAAVFGSALLRHVDEGKSAGDFLRRWTGR
ncbi:MAG: tryptophan synthase subunit alpha [Desulfovibrio sp.]|nr:tryptophan synthase subunit alpha [Desulfovibrio sp.]